MAGWLRYVLKRRVSNVRSTTKHATTYILGDSSAKLERRGAGESNTIGPYVFPCPVGGSDVGGIGHRAQNGSRAANRHLLLECCFALDLAIANAFHEQPDRQKVTCRNLGVSPPGDDACHLQFSQIDHVLFHQCVCHAFADIWVGQGDVLRRQHYLAISETSLEFNVDHHPRKAKADTSGLKGPEI
eukprot:9475650-Pyramimonas_sp.AAC.1